MGTYNISPLISEMDLIKGSSLLCHRFIADGNMTTVHDLGTQCRERCILECTIWYIYTIYKYTSIGTEDDVGQYKQYTVVLEILYFRPGEIA